MKKLLAVVVASVLFAGCANMTPVQKGASFGALTGAAIGGVWGHAAAGISGAQGALIGAATGGALGAAAGSMCNDPGYGNVMQCPPPPPMVAAPPTAPPPPRYRPALEK